LKFAVEKFRLDYDISTATTTTKLHERVELKHSELIERLKLMRCAICLELTSCICHQKRLTVCIQI